MVLDSHASFRLAMGPVPGREPPLGWGGDGLSPRTGSYSVYNAKVRKSRRRLPVRIMPSYTSRWEWSREAHSGSKRRDWDREVMDAEDKLQSMETEEIRGEDRVSAVVVVNIVEEGRSVVEEAR